MLKLDECVVVGDRLYTFFESERKLSSGKLTR